MFRKYLFLIAYGLLLIVLTAYVSFLDGHEYFSCLFRCDEHPTEFDYIIVGAGTAGSVVALRLSQGRAEQVLLLEAGSTGASKVLDIPFFAPLLHKSVYDWQYRTTPQENACWAFKDNASSWPSGKIFGGTGRLNHMLYTRGHPEDFKEWYKDVPDFSYEQDILYYFKKSEHQTGSFSNDTVYHGTRGPLTAADLLYKTELHDSIIEAAEILKFPIRDVNGEFSSGFTTPQANIRGGERYSTGHHVLRNKPPNLTIRTVATVQEILMKSDFEAYGVRYEWCGKTYEAYARRGVVVSAGTVGTAKLLMLSGIGPKGHLERVGIPPKVDLPVGNNLQDHVATGFDLVLFDKPLDVHRKLISPIEGLKYIFSKSGMMTSVGVDMLAFLNTHCLGEPINFTSYDECEAIFENRPDVEFLFMQAGISSDYGLRMKSIVGLKDEVWRDYYSKFLEKYAVSFVPIVLRPESVGTVRLRDRNVNSQPIINPNYLSSSTDVDVLVTGIKFIKKLVETEPMRRLGARLNNVTFPSCTQYEFATDDYWRCFVKYMSFTLYHPVGTCKMGPENDTSTVVTTDFKVKGTNRLYVVDASVIPQLISANTNAAVAMLAEKAADTIKILQYSWRNVCCIDDVFIRRNIC